MTNSASCDRTALGPPANTSNVYTSAHRDQLFPSPSFKRLDSALTPRVEPFLHFRALLSLFRRSSISRLVDAPSRSSRVAARFPPLYFGNLITLHIRAHLARPRQFLTNCDSHFDISELHVASACRASVDSEASAKVPTISSRSSSSRAPALEASAAQIQPLEVGLFPFSRVSQVHVQGAAVTL
jgi:hypothetical protein